MPFKLALLPVIESVYNPSILPHDNTAGLQQLTPATGQHFNLRQTNFYDDRHDITASTNATLTYLERLHDMFNGDWMLTLVTYNVGRGAVSHAIERNERLGLPTDYWNLPLPQEAQGYVPKLLVLSQIVMVPDSYGISLNPINNEPYFQAVRVKRGIDLPSVAVLVSLDKDKLYQLDPTYKRRVTMDGPQQLLVPMEKATFLTTSLNTLRPKEVTAWQQYRVHSDNSLRSIANRYRITITEPKSASRPSNNHLRKGQQLNTPRQIAGSAVKPVYQQLARQAPTPARTRPYKVKNNDSLWQIARSNGVDVSDPKCWSGLDKHALKVGQTLKLQGGTQTLATRRGNAAGKHDGTTCCKVKQGDSIYLIAKRFNVEMKHLRRRNPHSKQALKPGRILALYLDAASR